MPDIRPPHCDDSERWIDEPPHPEEPRYPRDHERSDVSARSIGLIAAGMLVCAVFIHLILSYVQYFLNTSDERSHGLANPLAVRMNQQPLNTRLDQLPSPRVEGLQEFSATPPYYRSSLPIEGSLLFHPEELRADRQPRLQNYGWVDKDKGIVHIPIGEAMRLALEKQLLPAQPGARPLDSSSAQHPNSSNSGRGAAGGDR